jgi:hypothetical protein
MAASAKNNGKSAPKEKQPVHSRDPERRAWKEFVVEGLLGYADSGRIFSRSRSRSPPRATGIRHDP